MWWIPATIGYVGYNIIYCLMAFVDPGCRGIEKLLPCDLHKSTRMNWFGCIFISILLLLILPLTWFIRFMYWLFHI